MSFVSLIYISIVRNNTKSGHTNLLMKGPLNRGHLNITMSIVCCTMLSTWLRVLHCHFMSRNSTRHRIVVHRGMIMISSYHAITYGIFISIISCLVVSCHVVSHRVVVLCVVLSCVLHHVNHPILHCLELFGRTKKGR